MPCIIENVKRRQREKILFVHNMEKLCNLRGVLWRKHGKSNYQNGYNGDSLRIQKKIKTDCVNTVVFNLHQIKQGSFFGTPATLLDNQCLIIELRTELTNKLFSVYGKMGWKT